MDVWGFVAFPPQCFRFRYDSTKCHNLRQNFLDTFIIGADRRTTGSSWFGGSGRTMGSVMQNGIATRSLSHEYFVLQMDGRVKSGYHRFVDALRAGLRLKDQYPQHDIKVRAAQAGEELQHAMQGAVWN